MEKIKGQLQIEQAKSQAQIQSNQAKAEMDAQLEQLRAQTALQVEQAKLAAHVQVEQSKASTHAQLEQVKAEIEVQREAAETEQKMQLEAMRIAFDRERAMLEDDRERDKQAADIQLRIAELELKYQTDLSNLVVTSQIEREWMQHEAATAGAKLDSSERVAAAKAPAKHTVQKQTSAPKKRRVTVERGPDGKPAAYNIEDVADGAS